MNRLGLAVLVTVCVLTATMVLAGQPGRQGGSPDHRYRPMVTHNTCVIDANNIKMLVSNHGSFAYDLTAQNSGLWYPKGTDKTCVYASGLWIGAQVVTPETTEVRIAAGSFSQEYGPGPMLGPNKWANPRGREHRTYKISTASRDSVRALGLGDYGEWPVDYREWPWKLGAPYDSLVYVDVNGDAVTDTVCYPTLTGDQTLWCVYNDADPDLHATDEGSTKPLGVEVQQTTFAFNWKGALGNTVFIKFKVINKGSNVLDSTYFAVWCDPDLGGASDDYVGCDTLLSVGYAYNATNSDAVYANRPPCVGYDFFQGPIGDDDKELPMVSFNKYINGTDPRDNNESYNYMRGLDRDGSTLRNPITGQPTKFFVPGDPVTNTGWLDSDPADRRFMLNTGPFTMAQGDTQEVVIGIVVGQSIDRISAVKVMRFFDETAQKAFDLDFKLPPPQDRPIVVHTELKHRIRLTWGTESEVNKTPGYTFEGYNVYQSASVSTAGPWQLIAVYDLVNGLATIEDLTLDLNFGLPIVEPVQFGTDHGMQRYIEITEDKVKGVPLSPGTPYYFMVSAYSYNPTPEVGLPKTLEGFSDIIVAIPQEAVAEATIMEDLDECTVYHGRINEDLPLSTDRVTVFVGDPYALTGDTYRVDFQAVVPPETLISGSDTTVVHYKWNLKNKDTGLYFYDQWRTNKTGDADHLVTDGFVAKVIGAHADGGIQDVAYVASDGCHRLEGLTAVDGGLTNKINDKGGKGVGYGLDFFGSTIDPVANADQFVTVEVRFAADPADPTQTQKAYRYTRRGYPYTGFFEVPFTVWDVTNNIQLNACFVENTGSAVFDSTWNPDATDDGSREYLFIMRSEYDPEGGLYDDDNWGPGADVLYAVWPRMENKDAVIEPGSMLKIVWGIQSTTNDYFEFVPRKAAYSNETAKSVLDDIRVVPNPYFAKSSYEINQFDHIVKFTNLPRKCTVRIFNLAGDLVRTLEKDVDRNDPYTSILEWNLFNDQGIPVASGFYIYHIDAPGIGSKYGKMAVFLEKERLNTF